MNFTRIPDGGKMVARPEHAHWRGGSATDRLFIITVVIKGIDGAFGVIGGTVLFFVKLHTINAIVAALTTHELSRQPDDYLSNLLVHWAEHLDLHKLAFAGGYLIVHGVIKSFLAASLLLGRPWSYPVGSAFLALFMAYTAYRLTLGWSWGLAAFFAFDLFTVIMVLREWRSVWQHQQSAIANRR